MLGEGSLWQEKEKVIWMLIEKSMDLFGAFVALDGGKSGLVHISEIANTYVNNVRDFVQEGQTVKVIVLSAENGKINLSIKKALPQPERTVTSRGPRPSQSPQSRPFHNNNNSDFGRISSPRAQQPTQPISAEQSFEDKLKQFLSSSEGKISDLNRNIDGKRGGRRRR